MRKFGALLLIVLIGLGLVKPVAAQNETLLVMIESDERFSIFAQAVAQSGISSLFREGGPYTALIPSNEAFSQLPAGVMDQILANTASARQLVIHHVLIGEFDTSTLLTYGWLRSGLNERIDISRSGNSVLFNGGVGIIEANIPASNGIIHILDAVLVPNGLAHLLPPPPPPPTPVPPPTVEGQPTTAPGDTPAPAVPTGPLPTPTTRLYPGGIDAPPAPDYTPINNPTLNSVYVPGGYRPYSVGIQRASGRCKGVTFVMKKNVNNVTLVGADWQTNPYRGDTYCEEEIPMVCFVRNFATSPPSELNFRYENHWSSGAVRITAPIAGTKLTSLGVANQICADTFGEGYRMLEFHDAHLGNGGWDVWAQGGLPRGTRFWVYIDDQFANPWNSVLSRASSTSTERGGGLVSPFDNPAYAGPGYMPRGRGESVPLDDCRGATWVLLKQVSSMALVGADSQTNPFRGDETCYAQRPVLCIKVDLFSPPPSIGDNHFNVNWSGAQVKTTAPVSGFDINTRAKAHNLCVSSFGNGWRMASMHDGTLGTAGSFAWRFWAWGGLVSGQRFWIAIPDQPANPWSGGTN